MSQNVMVTGAGKAAGLGYNLVLRYLEAGDTVVATIRKPCRELDELRTQYEDRLIVLFEKKREDFDSNRFITNLDEEYPF